jgi:hypothetical protein
MALGSRMGPKKMRSDRMLDHVSQVEVEQWGYQDNNVRIPSDCHGGGC